MSGKKTATLEHVRIYPNSHYVTPAPTLHQAVEEIKRELSERLNWLTQRGHMLEAQRLEQRIRFDIESMTGSWELLWN